MLFIKNRKKVIALGAIILVCCAAAIFVVNKGANKIALLMDKYIALSQNADVLTAQVQELTTQVQEVSNEASALTEELNNLQLYTFDYSWTETVSPLIAHAFGGVDGTTYTNSLEAFLYNYELGHRVFEVDFFLTEPENTLVATHDDGHWRTQISHITSAIPQTEFTYVNFMNQKIYDKYTTMDYRGIIDLMIEYPDIRIVTDSKFTDQTSVYLQFSQLVKYAEETDPTVLDRIIPQIYNEEMLSVVMDVYPFQSVIFTLYQTAWTPQSVYNFCKATNVRFVTLHYGSVSSEVLALWDELGIVVAAHTSNDLEQTKTLFESGVDFMYTDFLTPDMFE